MDAAHIHLMLNHIPVLGLTMGFVVLGWGAFRSSDDVKKVGLMMLVITALAAIPVYLTGEPAEEIVERLPGVSEQIIEQHEGSALTSLILAIVTGGAAFLSLIARRFLSDRLAAAGLFATLALALIGGGAMAYTANLGGQIRHTEIRQAQNSVPGNPAEPAKKRADDDDD